jgi:multicomponent Na+:H+ antiporter subunit E
MAASPYPRNRRQPHPPAAPRNRHTIFRRSRRRRTRAPVGFAEFGGFWYNVHGPYRICDTGEDQETVLGGIVLHAVSLGLVLFITWLLFSGFFEPLLLAFGVVSCLLVVWIAHRMDMIDREGQPIHLGLRIVTYWFWLIGEIVKANVDVARRIIDPKLPIQPNVFWTKASQHSELGQVIYANSITLTPGTISMRVADGSILVHALTAESAAGVEQGDMDRRVAALENAPGTDREKAKAR